MGDRLKQERAITLITLVITIIVLSILAGITIATLTGENGIVTKSISSKEKRIIAEEKEQIRLAYNAAMMKQYEAGNNFSITASELQIQLDALNVVTTVDGEPITVTFDKSKNIYTVESNGNITGPKNSGGEIEEKPLQEISSMHYGEYIDYKVDLGIDGDQDGDTNDIDDWRIFYKDDSGNIFIIAADYLPNSKLPSQTNMGTARDYPYSAYWPSASNLTRAGSSAISSNVAKKYMFSWLTHNLYNTNQNVKAVAALLDTAAWESFATGISGAEAIGGPTLEMYVASWNAKGYTTIYCNNSTNVGYYVGTDNRPTNYLLNISSDIDGYADTLYYPHTSAFGNCSGYWLATPSAESNTYLMGLDFTGSIQRSVYDGNYYGVRPIVSLPPETKVTRGKDGVWEILQ